MFLVVRGGEANASDEAGEGEIDDYFCKDVEAMCKSGSTRRDASDQVDLIVLHVANGVIGCLVDAGCDGDGCCFDEASKNGTFKRTKLARLGQCRIISARRRRRMINVHDEKEPCNLDPRKDSAGRVAATMQPNGGANGKCYRGDEGDEEQGVADKVEDFIAADVGHGVDAEPLRKRSASTHMIELASDGLKRRPVRRKSGFEDKLVWLSQRGHGRLATREQREARTPKNGSESAQVAKVRLAILKV